MRILVVDDHAVVRAGLHQMLASMMGAEVREAADGAAADAQLLDWRPEVVILDLGLPGAGGLALLPSFARAGLRVLEIPLPYRCRNGGESKVAGSLRGTLRASTRIISTFCRVGLLRGT